MTKVIIAIVAVVLLSAIFAWKAAAATGVGMTAVYKRVLKCKKASGLSWNEIAKRAGIKVSSWMTGLPTSQPTDEELRKIAPVLNTTYEYLKYGTE